jgi:hypothetical protein
VGAAVLGAASVADAGAADVVGDAGDSLVAAADVVGDGVAEVVTDVAVSAPEVAVDPASAAGAGGVSTVSIM